VQRAVLRYYLDTDSVQYCAVLQLTRINKIDGMKKANGFLQTVSDYCFVYGHKT